MATLNVSVKLTFTEPLLGSAALDPAVYSKYIEALKVKRKSLIDGEASDDESKALPENIDPKGTGFHRTGVGALYLYDYALKGFFKEVANILKETLGAEKALRSKLDNYLFVNPRRIVLKGADGKDLLAPHGVLERPLRAMTMQGPRVSLAMSEFINAGSICDFTVKVIDGCPVKHPERVIEACLEYGRDCKGLGQWRNGGYGRFNFEVKFS